MSLSDEMTRVEWEQTPPLSNTVHSKFRRSLTRALRAFGLVLAFLATVSLAAGVAIVGPNIDEWRGVLPSLEGTGYQTADDIGAADVLGWAQQQDQVTIEAPRKLNDPRSFAFLAPAVGDVTWPGHWCSESPIGYRVDLTGARLAGLDPALELRRWRDAFGQWASASNGRYRFSYRGEAKYPLVPNTSRDDMKIRESRIPSGEIAITYATSQNVADGRWKGYRHRGLVESYGLGGIGSVTWSPGSRQSGLVTRGSVMIDAADVGGFDDALPVVYIHEAGHALGLGHVNDASQMMYRNAGESATISNGDRNGIQKLATSGCPA